MTTIQEEREIVILHLNRMTVDQIARKVGVSLDDVRRVLIAAGHYRTA